MSTNGLHTLGIQKVGIILGIVKVLKVKDRFHVWDVIMSKRRHYK
jgi:hypothetical protein